MPVQVSVNYLTTIILAYNSLGFRCRAFDARIVQIFYFYCLKDLPTHGALWYENKLIKNFCQRKSLSHGIVPWIRTWLMFHGFYRLKKF